MKQRKTQESDVRKYFCGLRVGGFCKSTKMVTYNVSSYVDSTEKLPESWTTEFGYNRNLTCCRSIGCKICMVLSLMDYLLGSLCLSGIYVSSIISLIFYLKVFFIMIYINSLYILDPIAYVTSILSWYVAFLFTSY